MSEIILNYRRSFSIVEDHSSKIILNCRRSMIVGEHLEFDRVMIAHPTCQIVVEAKILLIVKDLDGFFDDASTLKLTTFGNDESIVSGIAPSACRIRIIRNQPIPITFISETDIRPIFFGHVLTASIEITGDDNFGGAVTAFDSSVDIVKSVNLL